MKTERTPDKTFEDYLEAMLIIKERKGIILMLRLSLMSQNRALHIRQSVSESADI